MPDFKKSSFEFFSFLKRAFAYVFFHVLRRLPVFVYGQNHWQRLEDVFGNQDSHMCELAQILRSSPSVGVPFGSDFIDGSVHLNETQPTELLMVEGYTELNRSQFVRLSRIFRESCSDLRGTQVKLLRDLCLVANHSEEFFLTVSEDLWLRTAFSYDSKVSSNFTEEQCCALFSSTSTREERRRLFSSIFTIHSSVVPRRPYWKRLRVPLRVVRGDHAANVASKYYPCTFLQAPLQGENSVIEYFPSTFLAAPLQGNTLSIAKLLKEWKDRMLNEINDIGMLNIGRAEQEERPFWKVGPTDLDVNVDSQKELNRGSEGAVWILSWRGGIFVRKEFFDKQTFCRELEVVRRVKSHPHIVYSFGVYDEKCLLMEKLERDLRLLMEDKIRLSGSEPPKPLFSRQDSVDMLLQIAKAMAHVHKQDVVHGDLKSGNILVSHCEIVGDVWHYIVKVADFGSATIINPCKCTLEPCKCTFEPADGTTGYAAPEVLQRRGKMSGSSERVMPVDFAKKGDVYSFAIIAFQVLTGELKIVKTKDVKAGERPPLRQECSKKNFWYDKKLIELIEEYWAPEPEDRPSFSQVTERLKSIYKNLQRSCRRQKMARRLASVLVVLLPFLLALVQYICKHWLLASR